MVPEFSRVPEFNDGTKNYGTLEHWNLGTLSEAK
jgi:hypothetical protein